MADRIHGFTWMHAGHQAGQRGGFAQGFAARHGNRFVQQVIVYLIGSSIGNLIGWAQHSGNLGQYYLIELKNPQKAQPVLQKAGSYSMSLSQLC